MVEMLRNPDNPVAASGHYFRILVLAMSSLVLAWSAAPGAGLEKQLEAAIHREVVLGDLAGAMKEYRNIVAKAGVPRPVAARALLQTGECMEKLGRGPEAYNSYRRVENEYGDQLQTACPKILDGIVGRKRAAGQLHVSVVLREKDGGLKPAAG